MYETRIKTLFEACQEGGGAGDRIIYGDYQKGGGYFFLISAKSFANERHLYLWGNGFSRIPRGAAFPLDFLNLPWCRLSAVEAVADIFAQLFKLGR